jgi:hypothetical protein
MATRNDPAASMQQRVNAALTQDPAILLDAHAGAVSRMTEIRERLRDLRNQKLELADAPQWQLEEIAQQTGEAERLLADVQARLDRIESGLREAGVKAPSRTTARSI